MNRQPFRVALTADFYEAGKLRYRDIGLSILKRTTNIELTTLESHLSVIASNQLSTINGVIVLSPRVTAESLENCHELLGIGRFGVGYDSVDVDACTAADVALFITSGAVDHSVAEATVAWMLALTHHIRIKDRLVREGQWNVRSRYMGCELRDRTLGLIGFGGIGKNVVKLLSSFSMATPLVFDPYVTDEAIDQAGARRVELDDLLVQSDFISLHCPLNDRTRNLLSSRELSLMNANAYLLNTARGGIVDEDALYQALVEHRIAGAALDCFSIEPVLDRTRWSDLDNVILAPHSIAWTEELFRDIGRSVCQGMLDISSGRRPKHVVNPEVFSRPSFCEKWERIIQRPLE